jgi:hypothetical protein
MKVEVFELDFPVLRIDGGILLGAEGALFNSVLMGVLTLKQCDLLLPWDFIFSLACLNFLKGVTCLTSLYL